MKTLFSIFIAFTLLVIPVRSQDYYRPGNKTMYGFFFNLDRNDHNWSVLTNNTFGDRYLKINGIGYGYDLGFLTEFPVKRNLCMGFRLAFQNAPGYFSVNEYQAAVINGHTATVIITNHLDTRLFSVFLEPYFSFNFFDNLSVQAGLNVGYIYGSHYRSYESLESSNATFTNGSRIRNLYEGEIPDISRFKFAVRAGLSYDIPLLANRSVMLTPALYYDFMLNSIINSPSWKINSIAGGISLKFRQ